MNLTGQVIVVTGASGGIGASFVRELITRGARVVAVARNRDRLEELAAELTRDDQESRVEVVALDLTDRGAGETLCRRLEELGLQVDGLINNAGIGTNGPFIDIPLDESLAQVDLDVRTVVELTGRFLPAMMRRRSGWIVNIASTAGYQPVPGMAVYGAAKAFVRSFTEALWLEAKPSGVRIFGVAPGGVETGFFSAAGAEFLTKNRLSAEEVVSFTLARLDASGPMAVPGLRNRLSTLGERLIPRRLLIRGSARIVAPSKPRR